MKTMRIAMLLAASVITIAAGVLRPTPDEIAVERAVADYVDALYEARPELIERSVHPRLTKHGFVMQDGAYAEVSMTYDQLVTLAARWNASGRVDPATAVKEIVVLDVLDQTASAKLVAEWGVDHLQLARYDGAWKIINVLWQVPPQHANAADEVAANAADEAAVRAVVDAFFEAMRTRDEAALRATALPEARLVNPLRRGGAMSIRMLSMDQLADMVVRTAEPYDERMPRAEVRIDTDLATVWGRYTFRVGTRLTNCGSNSVQLVRTGQGWRIAQFASTIETDGCES